MFVSLSTRKFCAMRLLFISRQQYVPIPMLLVQGIDAKRLLPSKRNCTEDPNKCLIGIAPKNESIPKIEVIVTFEF
jgi:hypothetical protein